MKKLLTMFMLLSMVLFLCACNNNLSSSNANVAQNSSSNKDQANVNNNTRTIVDSYGRSVEIPEKIERIVPLGNAPRMVTYLGLADKVVGVQSCEKADSPIMAYAYINIEMWKDLPNVGNDSLGAGEWYSEEIVACTPDVILCTYEKDIAEEIQTKTGIPVVAVTSPALFSDEYNNSLKILADTCNVSDRADEITDFINDCLTDIKNRTKDIKDDNKPTVLGAGATFKGSHSIDGVYANYPLFEVLSANDVAVGIAEKSGGLLVDREQILTWNPDMIFFDASSLELVKTDYDKDSAYFKQLKAVQNDKLYQWPNSTWHSSNVEIPLVSAYYVGNLLYPQAFSDVNFEQIASKIFDFFLNDPNYLKILEDDGSGYKKITLGE